MTDSRPVTFLFENGVMRPFGVNMTKRATEQWGEGEIVRLVEPVDRTQRQEGFYFANLADMWASLPEKYADEWWSESASSLRAYALMKCGFANITDYPCKTAGEAKRWAAYLERDRTHEYQIVDVRGNTVRRYTPKSQSRKSMPDKVTFRESSDKVLGFIADLIELPKDADQRKSQQ